LDSLALREALKKMHEVDERLGKIVELRVFGGLTHHEVAEAIGVSTRTVEREWTVALAWLRREFSRGASES
jgi:RNA polymerase sigma factor (sigma-70 family)